jgi:hypothetical protein
MRKSLFLAAIISSSAVLLTAADPQPLNVKPGLWQVTMTSTIQGLPAPSTTTYKSCVKKEDLAKYPFTDRDDKCTWTVGNSTGGKMDAKGTCMPPGEGKVDFNIHLDALNTESVTGTGQLSMNGPSGAMNGTYAATAKWIGAACPKERNKAAHTRRRNQ